ncbi:hypothetical protein ABH992_007765 [Bradyrhizobium yuanmingense]|uniref:Uncharacterized protein n=1 Tax=Bradyrhizobium yuanmingense TaxID=108015 RepID=A0ABV4GTT0_9BRAD
MQLAPDRFAHRAAGAVATDDVAGLERLDLALVRGIDAFEAHGYGMIVGTGRRIDIHVKHASAVIRLELRRRLAHDVEKAIMDARLVQDEVREFRQPVLDVLHPAAADDLLRRRFIRLPERGLVDPTGFLQHTLAEAIGVEHLHGAAGDAVGLTDQQAVRLLLDDAGLDVGELRELGGERQAGRPAADDEDIDLARHGARRSRCLNARGRIGDFRVARLKSIEMELHEHLSRQTLFGYCSVC